jgi:hypothetical protein
LDSVDDFPLFHNLRNLEELDVRPDRLDLIVNAAQNCPRINKLVLRSGQVDANTAFFPHLVDLEIDCKITDEIVEKFLLKHEKLESLKLDGWVNEPELIKILENLKNLRRLEFSLRKTPATIKEKYQRCCVANKKNLKNIWPMLGNLRTLAISGNGLDKYTINQEFPMIPGLSVINF